MSDAESAHFNVATIVGEASACVEGGRTEVRDPDSGLGIDLRLLAGAGCIAIATNANLRASEACATGGGVPPPSN